MLVANVAERATAKSLTEVIRVLLLLILVANVALTAASSASVAKPEPSPITALIDVIASRLVFVNTDTAATSVTFAAETPAIRSSSASILVAETIPKDWLAFRLTVPLTGIVVEVTPSTVKLIPVPAVINFIVPPSAEGTLVSPEPSPTKKAADTVSAKVAEVALIPARETVIPVVLSAIVGSPATPLALPIAMPVPPTRVRPTTTPLLAARIPVAPVRSATELRVEAEAVKVTPLSWKVPLIFTALLLNCNGELVASPSCTVCKEPVSPTLPLPTWRSCL